VHPFQRGVVTNWDALECLYHHIFYEQARAASGCVSASQTLRRPAAPQLGWKEGGEGGVLVAEPLFTTRVRKTRKRAGNASD
jgi:actin-related protein